MRTSITNETFIKKAIEKHGDKYGYTKVNYKTNKDNVIITCPTHGEFLMEPRNHLRSNSGCDKCKSNATVTKDKFIKKSKLVHGDRYDYSLVDYKNKFSKISIICSEHGIFEQVARNHYSGSGCQKCGDNNVATSRRLSLTEFKEKGKGKHKNRYDYSLVDYKDNLTRVKIICPKHGEFEQRPVEHLRGCGCQKCKESKGERTIREYLIDNKIKFIPQYKFDNCRHKNKLPFDFYLPDHNICIEYNGAQHYKSVKYWGGVKTLNNIKKRDKIKKDYCITNNIKLLIIRYNENTLDKLILLDVKP